MAQAQLLQCRTVAFFIYRSPDKMMVVSIVFTKLLIGDASKILATLESNSIDLCMTSPPYWGLRDYGVAGQIGLEKSFEEYIEKIAAIEMQIMRVLKPSGSFYLNMGDTYAGSNMGLRDFRECKSLQDPDTNHQYPSALKRSLQSRVTSVQRKSLIGMPWRIALRLMQDGWILRNDIIWYKPNHMPVSVKDRLSNSYEHLFHFVKSRKYYYDLDAIRVPHTTASIQRMMLAVKQGMKPRTTKYKKEIRGMKTVQGGKYFIPNWAKAVYNIKYGNTAPARNGFKLGQYRDSNPAVNILGKNPGDMWTVSTRSFRGAHFAVYPEALCVRPILSSTPEGVCLKCGSPTRKVSQGVCARSFNVRYRDGQSGRLAKKWGHMVDAPRAATESYDEDNYEVRTNSRVIWPGCSCDAGFEPATVLDPFAGSGTTLKVAHDNGRNGIGIEINPEYVKVASDRLGTAADLEVISLA